VMSVCRAGDGTGGMMHRPDIAAVVGAGVQAAVFISSTATGLSRFYVDSDSNELNAVAG